MHEIPDETCDAEAPHRLITQVETVLAPVQDVEVTETIHADREISRFMWPSLPQLEALAARYQGAPPPPQGGKAPMRYRMRLFTLDWSGNWQRLAFYRTWRG